MRLFLYGSLLRPALLEALTGRSIPLTPATLPGWRRVALPRSRYPTLRRSLGHVDGMTAVVDRTTLARLSAYEGPSYRLTRVVVLTTGGSRTAWAWIAPSSTRRDWVPPP